MGVKASFERRLSFLLVAACFTSSVGCKRSAVESDLGVSEPPPEIRYVLASVAIVRARPDPGAEVVARWPIGTRFVVRGRDERFLRVDQEGVRGFLFEGLSTDREPRLSELLASYDATAEGALAERRTWAERAAALAPDDEEAVRRLVEVLEKLGDQKALLRARRGLDTIRTAKAAEAAASNATTTSTTPGWVGPGPDCLAKNDELELEVRFDLSEPQLVGSMEHIDEDSCPEPGGCSYQLQVAGVVTGPKCAGARLLVLNTFEDGCVCKCEGETGQSQSLRFVDLGGVWVPVAHQDRAPEWALRELGAKVLGALQLQIRGLELEAPEELALDARRRLRKSWDGLRFGDQPAAAEVRTVEGLELHQVGTRYVLPRPDGTAAHYERVVPECEEGFATTELELDPARTSTHARVTSRYVPLESVFGEPPLTTVGRVRATKDSLFVFSRPEQAGWEQRYEHYVEATRRYREDFGEDRELLSRAEFLARIPTLVWRDPFGQYHAFIREELVVPEMAEPLIYLYAPEPTQVRVDVGEGVELLAADPPYEAGWSVTTRPDGALLDRASQRVIPAIFWEGRSLPLPDPEEGFVVPAAQVRATLEAVLPKLGLDARETADFVAYWAPRLRAAPYYQLSFLDPGRIDQMAPLLVHPKPDVFIRVHLDAKPLVTPVVLRAPRFRPVPERAGLVLVEWSGFRRASPLEPYSARNSPERCVPRR